MNNIKQIDKVDYNSLDKAKNMFIEASKKTVKFASKYGFIPDEKFGASANIFSLDLKPFLAIGAENLFITLLPEGLGTADDARPSDLSSEEAEKFWFNIAIKTVATMTNDVASSGLQPILISLYLPSSQPEAVFTNSFMKGFLDGFVSACRRVGCVYFSGETPQLKSKIFEDKLDIAGAVFGLMPSGKKPIDSSKVKAGDFLVFVESSGPHENGYTTLRKLAEDLPQGFRTKMPSGKLYYEGMNAPSVLYSPLVQAILEEGIFPSNVEPITGHGWQKLMRLKKSFRYVIEKTLPVPEIFTFFQEKAGLSQKEMIKIFNYGAGLAIYVNGEENAEKIVSIAKKQKLNAVVAGQIEASEKREVIVKPFGVTLESDEFLLGK